MILQVILFLPLLIQLPTQFVLILAETSIPSEDDWISNYLQSTFTTSTDILFIVDNRRFFTYGVSGYILRLFSHQKTFCLVTLDDDSMKTHATLNISLIEKLESTTLKQKSQQNSISRRPQYYYHHHHRNRRHSLDYYWFDSSTSSNTNKKSYQLQNQTKIFTPRTTTIILIKDFQFISNIQEIFLKLPSSGLKVVLLYDECTQNLKKLEKKFTNFSHDFWYKFHILFTYFIPFCSRTWDLNHNNNNNDNDNMKRRHPLFGVVTTYENREEINNPTITMSEHKSFINSLYVFDPFYLSKTEGWNDRNDQIYGKLRKINFTLDYNRTMNVIFVNKILKINGYQLRIVFHPTTMAILKTEIPYMSRNLTYEILTNPARTIESYFGLEIEVLKELAKRMNFTPDIWPSSDGMRFGFKAYNNIFIGAIGDIIYNRVDFGLNGYFIKDYGTRSVEFTTAISDDKLCLLVRSPDTIPNSLLLFKVFSPKLWLLIVCTILAASIIYTFLLFIVVRKCNLKDFNIKHNCIPFKSNNKRYNDILTMIAQSTRIIALLLQAPHYYRFNSTRSERIYAAVCLWWGLNIIGAFEGSLVDVLTNKISYPRIYTLEEFDKMNLKIATRFPGLKEDVFGNSENDSILLRNLKGKMFTTSHDRDLIKEIALNGNIATLSRVLDMNKYITRIPYSPDEMISLYFISECPRNYKIAYLFPKSSVYLPFVNIFLGRLASSGLLVKWQKDTEYIFQFTAQLQYNRNNVLQDEHLTILTASHLQFAFLILFFGYFVSFLILIGEIYWNRIRTKL